MFLIKLASIKNEKNVTNYSNQLSHIQFNQFFIYYTHNKNEIRESPETKVKAKGTSYETEK